MRNTVSQRCNHVIYSVGGRGLQEISVSSPKLSLHFKNPCLNVSPHFFFKCLQQPCVLPLRAMTLLAGFMMALSAEMGLRMGVLGSLMSMITTWACSPTFSRMQMNLSDSIVRVLNPIFAGFMPRFWSCKRWTDNIYQC